MGYQFKPDAVILDLICFEDWSEWFLSVSAVVGCVVHSVNVDHSEPIKARVDGYILYYAAKGEQVGY
jgi:uncharacterized membrane protein YecN with MAPEG domain